MTRRNRSRTHPARRWAETLFVGCALALLLGLVASGGARAGQSGAEFLALCDQDDDWSDGYCTGYIAGAGEMLDGLLLDEKVRAAFDGRIFCLPADVTKGEVRDRVVGFLREHPDVVDSEMTSITWAVLIEAYPCE